MSDAPRPTELKLGPQGELQIAWDDGVRTEVTPRKLRSTCPCATCREKASPDAEPKKPTLLPVLKPEEMIPLRVLSLRPVGSYAYGIAFTDGHRSGLYTLELLRSISTPVPPTSHFA